MELKLGCLHNDDNLQYDYANNHIHNHLRKGGYAKNISTISYVIHLSKVAKMNFILVKLS